MLDNKIMCPNCGHSFNAEQALQEQVEKTLRKEFQQKLSQQTDDLNKQKESLEKERAEVQRIKQQEVEILKKKLELKEKEIRSDAEKKAQETLGVQLKVITEENEKRKQENIKLQKTSIELAQREQALKDKQEQFELELQKQLIAERSQIEEKVRKTEQEKNELIRKEFEHKLNQQKELIEEMKRKAEQGSMQTQGEVQEEAIEEWLAQNFKFDTITEIKKGERGADCIQTINEHGRINIGTIYYESKRTKDFQAGWIEKLKTDMRERAADIGILVTQAMPKDMERMGIKDGIWICTFEEFKSLSYILRDSLIKIKNTIATQENKGDKMVMLYNYLTSTEFRQHIEAIVESFNAMKSSITKERNQMEKMWKEREKQLDKVLINATGFYGSIKGIAGTAVADINMLGDNSDTKQIAS